MPHMVPSTLRALPATARSARYIWAAPPAARHLVHVGTSELDDIPDGGGLMTGSYSSNSASAETSSISSAMSVGTGGTGSRRTPVVGDHTMLTFRSGSTSG